VKSIPVAFFHRSWQKERKLWNSAENITKSGKHWQNASSPWSSASLAANTWRVRALALPLDRIPTLDRLNDHITPHTGWKVVHANVRYSKRG
jgi:phenylalanine-4-hydroxylase